MTGALVVNADDLGVSRGATLAIVKAHREGIVTSASLAVTTPFYEHAVEACARTAPGLGLGLHFTLTAGSPVSQRRSVPLLVDRGGAFRWRFMPLLRSASLRRQSDLLDQIELELEAQLQRLVRDGVQVDHIDSERHVHLIPGIFERVVAAAIRHDIPFLRLGNEIGTPTPRHAVMLLTRGGFAKSWLLSTLSRRARSCLGGDGESRLRSADHFASYLYSGRLDLDNEFTMQSFNTRVERVAEILNDPSILIGLGDAGAHLDMLCDSGYPTYVLGTWVRERQALSLEEAVRRMTSDPADFFGIRDRGRLKVGMAADIAIFDPATVGSADRLERRYDLPGGAKRMVMRSKGVECSIVNGEITWSSGELTGAAAGRVLRS